MNAVFRLALVASCVIVLSSGFSSHEAIPRGRRSTTHSKIPLQASVDDDVRTIKSQNKVQKSKYKANKNRNRNKNTRGKQGQFWSNNNGLPVAKFVELNKKIISAESSAEIIDLLASTPDALTKTAGGGSLSSVNFATSIHRIGRYLSHNYGERTSVLSNPKFALFLCSYAEALAGVDYTQSLFSLAKAGLSETEVNPQNQIRFSIREKSNLVWALAKLRLVPPISAIPIGGNTIKEDLLKTSIQLRTEVIEAQKLKDKSWIPSLSLLTAKLMDTISYTMMDEMKEGERVNTQEMVNSIWAFAAAQRPSDKLFDTLGDKLIVALEDCTETPNPQEFSNVIWAFATAGYQGKNKRRIIKLMTEFFESDPRWLSKFKPQELSNTAWGLSTLLSDRREAGEVKNGTPEQKEEDLMIVKILRFVAQGMTERCDEYKPQEISNTMWSFGTLGFGIGIDTAEKKNLNDFVILKSDDYDRDAALVDEMLVALRTSVVGRLFRFKEQELNNLAHGCGRLNRSEPEIFAGIAGEFAKRRGRVTGQDIGTTLWSFATTRFWDKTAFQDMLSRVQLDAVRYWKPQEVSNTVWAIGTAGITPRYPKAFDTSLIPASERVSFAKASQDPFTLTFAAAAKELLRRPQEFKTQEIKDSLWAFSKAGVRHPLVFRSIAEYLVGRETDKVPPGKLHCGKGLDDFSSQEVANLCWAYAKQGQLASENSEKLNGRMAVYCSSAVDVGETLLKRFVNCAAEADLANYGDLSHCSTNDLSNTIWSLATLGTLHQEFVEVLEAQILDRFGRYVSGKERSPLTRFCGQEVGNLLWSLATLNSLRPEVLDIVEPYMEIECSDADGKISARSIAMFMNRQELGNLAWSCTVAGHYPPVLTRIIVRGLIGEGEEQRPEYMDELHEENGGLRDYAVMSLLYLFYGLQVDGAKVEGISIPPNFPNGWGDCELTLDDESGISLSLTTSKVQQDVSAAFTRVGFEHVQEHIVSMESIDIGIDLLSLDLADPSRKIGIEVDGPSHFFHDLKSWSPQDPPKGHVRVASGINVEYNFDWNADRNKPNGSTCLKDRLLQKLGWKVIHVPFWDWYAMSGDAQAEENYCRNILEQM